MRNDDLIAQLRAVDPIEHTDLSRIDPGALSALREGITMTTTPRQTRTRRLTRRTAIIGGLSIALVGGGAAYAAHVQFAGGDADGVNCQHVWNETAAGVPAVMGPALTGDPVADCAVYAEQGGTAPIIDPVAFTYEGMVFVTPADQVPEGATLFPPSPDAAATRELEASMRDWVDGGSAHCPDEATITAFAHAEIERVGLPGWTVTSDGLHPTDGPEGLNACAAAWVDLREKTITVLPNRAEDVETAAGPETSSIRTALRAGIADTCVDAATARAVADAALAGLDYAPWPTTTVLDESVPCARVDMEVGGNVQVTVYGPTTARP